MNGKCTGAEAGAAALAGVEKARANIAKEMSINLRVAKQEADRAEKALGSVREADTCITKWFNKWLRDHEAVARDCKRCQEGCGALTARNERPAAQLNDSLMDLQQLPILEDDIVSLRAKVDIAENELRTLAYNIEFYDGDHPVEIARRFTSLRRLERGSVCRGLSAPAHAESLGHGAVFDYSRSCRSGRISGQLRCDPVNSPPVCLHGIMGKVHRSGVNAPPSSAGPGASSLTDGTCTEVYQPGSLPQMRPASHLPNRRSDLPPAFRSLT